MTNQYDPYLERQNQLQINQLYAVYYVNPVLHNNQYFQKENIFLAEGSSIAQRQNGFSPQTQSLNQIVQLTQRDSNLNQEALNNENFFWGQLFNSQSQLPNFQQKWFHLYANPLDYLAACLRFQQNTSYSTNESLFLMVSEGENQKYPSHQGLSEQKVTTEDSVQQPRKENSKKDKKTLNFCLEIRELTRQQRVKRYLIKKGKRRFCKKILYTSRKLVADHRERLRGKFAPKSVRLVAKD